MMDFKKGGVMKVILRWGIALVALAGICFSADESQLKEGKWTITTIMKIDGNSGQAAEMEKAMKELENLPPAAKEMMKKMQGMNGGQMAMGTQGGGLKTTITQCITNANPVPKMEKGNDANACKQTHEVKGNTITFHSVCKDKDGQVEVDGKMTFTGETMEGQMKSHQVSKAGQVTDATIGLSGKYVGPCK
jgi:hypothetical protein